MKRKYEWELPNEVGRTVTVARDLALDTVSFEFPDIDLSQGVRPIGDISDLKRARSILSKGALNERQLDHGVHYVIGALLAPMALPQSSRQADEVKSLKEISALASSLAARVKMLSDKGRLSLGRQLPSSSFRRPLSALEIGDSRCWSIIIDLLDLSACAENTVDELNGSYGEDIGGNIDKSMDTLHYGDPLNLFIERAMGLYEKAFGVGSVTKTTPKVPGTGVSCYALADRLHMYAVGSPLGHRNRFIAMVDDRNARRLNERLCLSSERQ